MSGLGCAEVEVRLADGAVAARDAAVRAHLAGCDACRAVAESGPAGAEDLDQLGDAGTGAGRAFILGAEVARGGMGRIVLARDLRMGREVAVKELATHDPLLAARFEREAHLTARLQHPAIVPVYEIGRWADGTPFYAMRMVRGRTLREAIAAAGSLAQRLALIDRVITAADAVAFAHEQRVVHRDLSPSNILVGEHGETVVIDWGLAKELDADDDAGARGAGAPDADAAPPLDGDPYRDGAPPALTLTGAVLGTAAYMAPEQARGEAVDARADVYALGAILHHLLAGTPPYGGTTAETLAALRAGPPRALAVIARGVPRDLASIVAKAMARERGDRYRDAGELAAELRRFRDGRVVAAHAYSSREQLGRWMRRHPVVLATALVALASGTIAVTGVVRARDRARSERRVAEQALAAVYERTGRDLLARGDHADAATYLAEAVYLGRDSAANRFSLGRAERALAAEATIPAAVFDAAGPAGEPFAMAIAWSPDDRELAIVHGGVVRIADAGTGEQRRVLRDPTGRHLPHGRRPVLFSRDGAVLVTGGEPPRSIRDTSTVARWDVATGALLAVREHAHGYEVSDDPGAAAGVIVPDRPVAAGRCATAPDGGRVACFAPSGKVTFRARGSEVVLGELTVDPSLLAGRFVGPQLLLEHEESLALWDPARGRRLATWRSTGAYAVSNDGRRLAFQRVDGGVDIVALAERDAIARWSAAAAGVRELVAVDDHGRLVLAVDAGGRAVLTDGGGRRLPLPPLRAPLALSLDGGLAAGVDDDGRVAVLDTATGASRARVDAGPTPQRLAIAGGTLLAIGGDHHARAWSIDRGAALADVADTSDASLDPTGSVLLACRGARPAMIVELDAPGGPTARPGFRGRDHASCERVLAAGTRAAIALDHRATLLSYVVSGEPQGHDWLWSPSRDQAVPGVAVDALGTRLALAAGREIWWSPTNHDGPGRRSRVQDELFTGAARSFVADPLAPVAQVALTPDGWLIATERGVWDHDGAALWSLPAGASAQPPSLVRFSRDGTRLIVAAPTEVTILDVAGAIGSPAAVRARVAVRTGQALAPSGIVVTGRERRNAEGCLEERPGRSRWRKSCGRSWSQSTTTVVGS